MNKENTTLPSNRKKIPAGDPNQWVFENVAGSGQTGNFGSTEGMSGAGAAQETVEEVRENSKTSEDRRGLRQHLSEDLRHTKEAMTDLGESLTYDPEQHRKAQIDAGADPADVKVKSAGNKWDETKKIGGDYLEKMGRGNKTFGAAKVAGYMVGASMLADFLNPFDDD